MVKLLKTKKRKEDEPQTSSICVACPIYNMRSSHSYENGLSTEETIRTHTKIGNSLCTNSLIFITTVVLFHVFFLYRKRDYLPYFSLMLSHVRKFLQSIELDFLTFQNRIT